MKKIMSILLVLLLVFGLTACGGESPEQAVSNALSAVKEMNMKTASKYLDYNKLMNEGESSEESDNVNSDVMMKLILKKFDYKVISSSTDANSATVKVEITNTDMSKIIADFFPEMFGLAFSGLSKEQLDDKYLEIFTNLMNRPDNKIITKTVEIKLTKNDKSWEVGMSDELADAIYGGMLTAADNMNNSFGSGDSGSSKLSEINNWLTDDIWNKGFCDISWYASSGTSSTGDTLDVDFTLAQLDAAMSKKTEYDSYMDSLNGDEYSQVKTVWAKLSPEIDTLYTQIKTKKPIANDSSTDIDTGKFTQYQEAFSDAINDID
jgi:hypothetical protein